MYLSASLLLFFNSAPCWLVWARHNHKLVLLRECQRKWGHPPYTQHVRGSFLLPILVDVAIACEFDGASSSLQRALNDVVPDLIGHCCDVQIHEKLRDALKLLHGEFSHLKKSQKQHRLIFCKPHCILFRGQPFDPLIISIRWVLTSPRGEFTCILDGI